MSMWARLDELASVAPLEQIMRVNHFGAVYCTYHALPHLKRARGRIVAVSSLAGKAGVPTRTGYAASKHAMTGFFDSLRIELDGSGVTVTLIYPGFVATGVRRHAFAADGRPLGASPVQEGRVLMDVHQMGRYAHENGFDILRAGVIKAHNGLITKVRAA